MDDGGYHEALAALQARGRFGIRLGLGRMRALLHALGDPHRELRGVLIGGTNGKGSVQAMVGSVLRAAGHRVGQTPKPHLVSYRERLQIDGGPIDPAAFAAIVGEVSAVADRVTRRAGPPTEFEVLTAAAFTWFQRQRVDLAVVEVGLGGRLDATNVWDGGVAAITNVDRDHMDLLGNTVTAIAREKAAIVKRGDRAVTGADGEALAVIRRRARRMGVPLTEVSPLPVEAMAREGIVVTHPGLGSVRVGLLGRHQAANASVALGVLEALRGTGVEITDEAVRAGLARTRWPGRLELLSLPIGGPDAASPDPGGPRHGVDVLLDGAHNAAGVASLVAALDELRGLLSPGPPTLLVALMADKEVREIGARLGQWVAGSGARVIATRVEAARSLPPGDLADAIAAGVQHPRATPPIHVTETWEEGLETALAQARAAGGPLVVAGSLYLVGAVRGRLVDDPLLRDPVAPPTPLTADAG